MCGDQSDSHKNAAGHSTNSIVTCHFCSHTRRVKCLRRVRRCQVRLSPRQRGRLSNPMPRPGHDHWTCYASARMTMLNCTLEKTPTFASVKAHFGIVQKGLMKYSNRSVVSNGWLLRASTCLSGLHSKSSRLFT